MKKLLLVIILFTCQKTFSQTETAKTPKEIKVNWDTKMFEAALPVDEPFILVVYSKNAIPTLVLMRYIQRNIFYYYEQPIHVISDKQNVDISTITKQTVKTTTKDGATTTETNVEYNGDPSVKLPFVRKYSVPPLRANFYYALLPETDYNSGADADDISTNGLKVQKDKGAVTNSYLSYQDNTKRKVTAIIGVSYFNAQTKLVRPYLGLRYNFVPINKDIQSRYYEEMHFQASKLKRFANRLSLDFGITLASIEDTTHKQYDLFGKSNLLTGLGYRLGDGFFLSTGALWYNKKDLSNPSDIKFDIKRAWYISLSFDWDFSKSFDALKKSLGASL